MRLMVLTAPLALAATCALAPGAEGATPSLTWAGADRIAVHCQADARNDLRLQQAFCDRFRKQLAARTRLPVAQGAGSPMVEPPSTVTLIVQVGVEPGRSLAFTVRPFRRGVEDTTLFGTVPRIVPISGSGVGDAAAEAAIVAALEETLP